MWPTWQELAYSWGHRQRGVRAVQDAGSSMRPELRLGADGLPHHRPSSSLNKTSWLPAYRGVWAVLWPWHQCLLLGILGLPSLLLPPHRPHHLAALPHHPPYQRRHLEP